MIPSTAHHRHHQHGEEKQDERSFLPNNNNVTHQHPPHEASPLLFRHFSMEEDESSLKHYIHFIFGRKVDRFLILALLAAGIAIFFISSHHRARIVPIEHAQETMLDIGNGLKLWYRTWGNRQGGIPVLFVHGGPGNAIADYHNGNKRFFAPEQYFVIEVDQRGTGKSQPSVRNDWHNMKYYKDISMDKMSHDYELVRKSLNIDRWLVFGGSWGSTLSLDYGMRYPDKCLGLILRGIYLNTVPEFNAVFSRDPYLSNPKRLNEFDTWFALAAQDALDAGETPLDPNDAERFFQIYERMIERGDVNAIWHYHVFENNLMEEDPKYLLDPSRIDETVLPEATSVAFFETRLFLHGTFEDPVNLLSRVDHLQSMHTWICQGRRDEVCPVQYAHQLANALREVDASYTTRFLDAGHEATDPVMAACLKESLQEFIQHYIV